MGKGRHEPASFMFELRREVASADGFSRDTAEAHEIEAGNGVAFNKLEGEQKNHARKPGYVQEIPAAVEPGSHPRARKEQEQRAGDYHTVVEYGYIARRFGKEDRLPHLP